jgi:hypothetical protein
LMKVGHLLFDFFIPHPTAKIQTMAIFLWHTATCIQHTSLSWKCVPCIFEDLNTHSAMTVQSIPHQFPEAFPLLMCPSAATKLFYCDSASSPAAFDGPERRKARPWWQRQACCSYHSRHRRFGELPCSF